MWVGGTVGLWSSKTKVGDIKGDNQLSFKVMPEFGYILSENIGVGIAVSAAHSHTGGLEFDDSASASGAKNSYKVNPFIRYTFLKGNLGSLFVNGGVDYEWGKL